MLHGDLKYTRDMWVTKFNAKLSGWKFIQPDRSILTENTKVTWGLIEGYVEEVLLKVRYSFFKIVVARKYKAHICNRLNNPKDIPMKR